MIEVYLYGDVRKIVERNIKGAHSIMLFDYIEGEKFQDFLHRLGLESTDVGDCFINNNLVSSDDIIHDNDTIELNSEKR